MPNLANTNGRSVADRNRQIRQEALREQLAAKGHMQHVLENIDKMQELADDERLEKIIRESNGDVEEVKAKIAQDEFKLKALNAACDKQLKLLNKLLPDAREVEIKTVGNNATLVLNYTGMNNPTPPEEIEGEVIENE